MALSTVSSLSESFVSSSPSIQEDAVAETNKLPEKPLAAPVPQGEGGGGGGTVHTRTDEEAVATPANGGHKPHTSRRRKEPRAEESEDSDGMLEVHA